MKDGTERELPDELTTSWTKATADPDPLAALGASLTLAGQVDRWQGTLVAEAIRGGATWEQIGEALGTSRQAAWARFRQVVEEKEGRDTMEDETARLKTRIRDEVRSLRESMRAMDDAHRKARMEAVQKIREMDRQVRQERQELKDRMKETVRSLQEEFRGRRRPA